MSQSSITKKYFKLINDMEAHLRSKPTFSTKREQTLTNSFREEFLIQIYLLNDKLKITKDNDFAYAIVQHLSDIESNFHKDFKRSQERISYLGSLARIASKENFISKKCYEKVRAKSDWIKNLPQFRLNVELDTLTQEESREDFRETFFQELRKVEIDLEDDDEVSKAYEKFYEEAIKNYDRKLVIKIDEIISKFQDKYEILQANTLTTLQAYLGTEIGKNDQQIEINKLLRIKAQQQSLSSNQIHKQRMQQQYEYLRNILNKFSSMKLIQNDLKIKLNIAIFGSNVSGFASKNTDIDLTILTDCYINELNFLRYLQKFLEAEFKEKDKNSYKIDLVDARIPLIKLRFYNKDIEFHFDIIVNNILGVINSKFLSVYGQIPWIKQMIILVKQWGKAQGLVSQNLFSSYGLTIMVLHFLISTNKIKLIMDSRTRGEDAPHFKYKRNVRNTIEIFSVYYSFKTNAKDVTSLKRVNLYELLLQFFAYYYEEGEEKQQNGGHWKVPKQERIISVDGGLCEYDDSCIFTIKDPFDEKHNPGRVKTAEKNKVMIKFKIAIETMRSKIKKDIENMFSTQ